MDWLAERRRMLGMMKENVRSFEDFISKSSIVNSFYSYSSNVTIPIDTENSTKYVIAMLAGVSKSLLYKCMTISKISNGVVTNLFSYSRNNRDELIATASGTSAILFNKNCIGIIIDPLDLNMASCDELLRSASVIDIANKNSGDGSTIAIQNPYQKGAKYVIAGLSKQITSSGMKVVKVDSDISFTELASSGDTDNLLTGVRTDNSDHGFWYVYSNSDDFGGVAVDTFNEGICALSFEE